jgi:hypothetical protein
VVVDNGSVDLTPVIALSHGATVVVEPQRGYGNAYKAGFAYATGDIVATGDADLTYPFCDLPAVVERMDREQLDFVTTDRLSRLDAGVMCRSHIFGNWLLSLAAKLLFRLPFKDSQSGMWVFRRHVWDSLEVTSSGMPFSQELKIEAFVRGFRCAEVQIAYRARAGEAKLRTITDGFGNVWQMIRKRFSLGLFLSRASIVTRPRLELPDSAARSAACDTARKGRSADAAVVWDERWFDLIDGLDATSFATATMSDSREAHRCVIDVDEPYQPRRMVVWRSRPETAASAPVAVDG